ncbi:nostrin [Asbolus verrucosus]|uniref:Nostrin n=1 Tax=Asbolus verrucosus TaxID=1661398 RepID=A0A482V8H9_ASBVE|nr:nostrin [Asbolus verrucosus]
MKKFCNKITKQQWRVTVPNINTSLFRRIPVKGADDIKSGSRNSGSYDLEQAQKEYDKSRSLPNSMYVNSDTSSDTGDENYEDARASARNSNRDTSEDDFLDTELYVDVNMEKKAEEGKDEPFEYDVPKISFSFFAKKSDSQENTYENEESIVVKSEVKIRLSTPESEIAEEPPPMKSESIEILPVIGIIKCGSDPNLVFRDKGETDDGLYKIPRKLAKCRLSQSLNDFNVEEFQAYTSDHSSIEHVSCSQVLVQKEQEPTTANNSESMDYCKTRSRLPLKLRRPTFLKKPKKAVDTWNNFRTKFNNIIAEHAAQQRVGAYSEKDKIVINFEEVYKTSKMRCKNAFKSTRNIFKRSQDASFDSETSSQIVKNDAFFARVPLTPKDIEYKFNFNGEDLASSKTLPEVAENVEEKQEFDFSSIKSAFRRSKFVAEGQNGFEDLRRYVKQGGDFCKELATILQERAETETQYAKNLSKLSAKLSRACRDGVGGLNEAWKAVAVELEARAEVHRMMGQALLDETAKPLRNLTENQHRTRKQWESSVDKAAKSLAEWRTAEAKGKKQSHTCARDNEKLQDAAILDTTRSGKLTLSRSTSLIQLAHMHNKNSSDKENAKLEGKKRKAEDAVKKADIEYYTLCVRAERARLEWESAVLRGVNTFQSLEEERLNNLKTVLTAYLHHGAELGPRLIEATERLKSPVLQADSGKDLGTFVNLRQSSQQVSEQLLPDFYCEHITLAMNRERRKQALVKLLHLIRQDIERERKSKNGLENLSKAIKQTPNFGAEDSQQSVSEKLYHMKSMLTYLEGARYKVHNALAELDSKPRSGHPLAAHITITRDKSGLQQSILKCSSADNVCNGEDNPVQPIAHCKALYAYTPNLTDELALQPGDFLSVYRQQDDGWWLGECKGNVGIFPATYVELINSN